jgi:hypothetical protein
MLRSKEEKEKKNCHTDVLIVCTRTLIKHTSLSCWVGFSVYSVECEIATGRRRMRFF